MLGFFDESGDPGLKVGEGSSRYFVVVLVTFEAEDEAIRCDQRIGAVRRDSRLPDSYECHYSKNSRRQRESFLRATEPYAFGYHALIADKYSVKLGNFGIGPAGLYNHIAGLLFTAASGHLRDLTVVMDKRGSRQFRREIALYLRTLLRTTSGKGPIKRLNVQDSHRNNLLQLADYVSGIVKRSAEGDRQAWQEYERFLSRKQVTATYWP